MIWVIEWKRIPSPISGMFAIISYLVLSYNQVRSFEVCSVTKAACESRCTI
jgi:hypothetical protein